MKEGVSSIGEKALSAESMIVDEGKDTKESPRQSDESTSGDSKPPAENGDKPTSVATPKSAENSKSGEDSNIPVDQPQELAKVECVDMECSAMQVMEIVKLCMAGLELCLSRFPHHYKSLYRLAYVYHHYEPVKVRFMSARNDLVCNKNNIFN